MPKVGTAAADPLKPFVRLRLLSLLLLLAPAWDGAALAQPMRAAVLAALDSSLTIWEARAKVRDLAAPSPPVVGFKKP